MKTSFLLLLVALVRQGTSDTRPLLQWDPDTVADCVDWYDNYEGESCEYVREYFDITPEIFHKWNPSVGLDCTPWWWQSYCIVTLEKLNQTAPTTTSSTITSTATLKPSPTAWAYEGCYVEDSKLPILEQNMNPGGDTALTIPKCKNSCYRRAYSFAGLQQGNQCWCSNYVAGEWSSNKTDCNTPCTGDKSTFCGGKGFVDVFSAKENQVPTSSTSITTSTSAITSTSIGFQSAIASKTGAAARNVVMLWKM